MPNAPYLYPFNALQFFMERVVNNAPKAQVISLTPDGWTARGLQDALTRYAKMNNYAFRYDRKTEGKLIVRSWRNYNEQGEVENMVCEPWCDRPENGHPGNCITSENLLSERLLAVTKGTVIQFPTRTGTTTHRKERSEKIRVSGPSCGRGSREDNRNTGNYCPGEENGVCECNADEYLTPAEFSARLTQTGPITTTEGPVA